MNTTYRFLRRYGWLAGVIAITLAWSLLLVGDTVPSLRGPAGRRWSYEPATSSMRIIVVGLLFFVYLIVAIWLLRETPRQINNRNRLWIYLVIGWAFVGTPLIQCAVIYLRHPDILRELFDRTASLNSGGYFSAVVGVENIHDYLRRFPALMPDFPIHPKRHPPGIPLTFWLTRQAFSTMPGLAHRAALILKRFQCDNLWLQYLSDPQVASAWVSMALPGLTALTLLPLYQLARHLLDRQRALFVVLLYPLIPSVSLFATMWDQFIPLFTTLGLLGLIRGMEERRLVVLVGAGVAISVGTFFSLGTVTGLAVLGLYGLFWHVAQRPFDPRRMILDSVAFAAGLASVWLIYWLFWGVTLVEIWRVAMTFHFNMKDTYLPSVFHLYDFLVFLGIPLIYPLIRTVRQAVRSPRGEHSQLLSLAFVLGLLVIDLSGSSKGEVARVWMFLIPWALVVVAQGLKQPLHQATGRQQWWTGCIVLLLIGIQTFSAATNLRVIHTRYGKLRAPASILSRLPPQAKPIHTQFADGIELVGWEVGSSKESRSAVDVTLYWRADAPVTWPWTVFRHVVADGELVGQHDGQPVGGRWPATCWEPGQLVVDTQVVPLDTGDLDRATLRVGLYDAQSGDRLPIHEKNGDEHNDVVEISLSP
jgi:hypothetical protein